MNLLLNTYSVGSNDLISVVVTLTFFVTVLIGLIYIFTRIVYSKAQKELKFYAFISRVSIYVRTYNRT